jgi:hypothetical protein
MCDPIPIVLQSCTTITHKVELLVHHRLVISEIREEERQILAFDTPCKRQ